MMWKQQQLLILTAMAGVLIAQSAWASESRDGLICRSITKISRLRELDRPATTVKEWLSQSSTLDSPVQVKGVRLNQVTNGF
ncbi:hypothetical protein [Tolypothrix sp. VBCCA 56010]|uniref:hypothetical protein n=1 Tax=Tolypothrix sp. VBCCA 56010 TaxID=3137731 RepID=UPI003D7D1E93